MQQARWVLAAALAAAATAPILGRRETARPTAAFVAGPCAPLRLRSSFTSAAAGHCAQRPAALAGRGRRHAHAALPTLRAVATSPAPNGVANKIALVALGCPKNTVDAEVMLGDLQKQGFEIVRQPRDADVVIVNTCTFVEDAKTESITAVLEAVELKSTTAKGVVVTGCMAQRYAQELSSEMPEVDAVIGFESYADISKSIERIISQSGFSMPEVSVGSTDVPFRPEWERVRITQQHSAFLRVAEGCDHKCTFCAIPSWRGKFRSKGYEAIMNEARMLASCGVTELNLIAEDTNQWGQVRSCTHAPASTPTHPPPPPHTHTHRISDQRTRAAWRIFYTASPTFPSCVASRCCTATLPTSRTSSLTPLRPLTRL
jgi:hypothetical protein